MVGREYSAEDTKMLKYDPSQMYLTIAHAEAIAEENRRNMRAVDAAQRTAKLRSLRANVRSTQTLHDLAQDNEFLRLLLRRAQKAGSM